MKTLATISAAFFLIGTCSAMALTAGKTYGGIVEVTTATTGDCAGDLGNHEQIQLRVSDGMIPAGMWIRHEGGVAFLQSADMGLNFLTDGSKGKIKGTAVFDSHGPTPGVYQQTVAGTYTFKLDETDPNMVKIIKMTVKFTMKPSGVQCSFIYNGVMTPALQ